MGRFAAAYTRDAGMEHPELKCPITPTTEESDTIRLATLTASLGSERSSKEMSSMGAVGALALYSATAISTARLMPWPMEAMSPVSGMANATFTCFVFGWQDPTRAAAIAAAAVRAKIDLRD